MADKYYTVEQISQMLAMHPKTIQRYIREGKLHAFKVGKSWRVAGHDLSVFVKNTRSAHDPDDSTMKPTIEDRCKASAVIDILVYHKEDAMRITDMLTATLNAKPPEFGNSSMHTQYVEAEHKLRITLWGGIRFMKVMMDSISELTEQVDGWHP